MEISGGGRIKDSIYSRTPFVLLLLSVCSISTSDGGWTTTPHHHLHQLRCHRIAKRNRQSSLVVHTNFTMTHTHTKKKEEEEDEKVKREQDLCIAQRGERIKEKKDGWQPFFIEPILFGFLRLFLFSSSSSSLVVAYHPLATIIRVYFFSPAEKCSNITSLAKEWRGKYMTGSVGLKIREEELFEGGRKETHPTHIHSHKKSIENNIHTVRKDAKELRLCQIYSFNGWAFSSYIFTPFIDWVCISSTMCPPRVYIRTNSLFRLSCLNIYKGH